MPFSFFLFSHGISWHCRCVFVCLLFDCLNVQETITWTDSHFVCHSRGQYYNGYMYTKYLGKIDICLKLQPQLMCILKGWGWNSERSLCTSGIRHVFIYQRRYYVVRSVQKLWLGRSVYQVRFFNLTLSAGVVCVVCRLFVTTGPFFLEASTVVFMWSNGHYGVYLGPCRRIFQNFHFYPFFWVKNSQKMAQKWHFCTKCWGLFSWSHL